MRHDWDWAGARDEAMRALKLDPHNASALAWSGYVFWALGDMETALDFLQRAAAVDPLNAYTYEYLANALFQAGQPEGAQEAIRKASNLNPNAIGIHRIDADLMVEKGLFDAALAEINQDRDEENRIYVRAVIYHAVGPDPRWKAFLKKMNLPE